MAGRARTLCPSAVAGQVGAAPPYPSAVEGRVSEVVAIAIFVHVLAQHPRNAAAASSVNVAPPLLARSANVEMGTLALASAPPAAPRGVERGRSCPAAQTMAAVAPPQAAALVALPVVVHPTRRRRVPAAARPRPRRLTGAALAAAAMVLAEAALAPPSTKSSRFPSAAAEASRRQAPPMAAVPLGTSHL